VSAPLKLRAEDEEDYGVVAACLQDALVPVGEMQYLADEKAFVLVANRFRWENCSEAFDSPPAQPQEAPQPEVPDAMFVACQAYERVNCALRIDGVAQVKRRGFDPKDRARVLEILHIGMIPAGAAQAAVELLFAGDAAIRLEGGALICRLQDMGEPWPTLWRPRHVPEDATSDATRDAPGGAPGGAA
jgi:hypothetical protein